MLATAADLGMGALVETHADDELDERSRPAPR